MIIKKAKQILITAAATVLIATTLASGGCDIDGHPPQPRVMIFK